MHTLHSREPQHRLSRKLIPDGPPQIVIDEIEFVGFSGGHVRYSEIPADLYIDRIEIIGSAGGAGFSEYWLEYGSGEVPALWYSLGTVQTEPKRNTCLHKWDTGTLAEGRYTLRLSVKSENGDIKRVKAVVDVNRKDPFSSTSH